jgi:hypothetical protein
MPTSAEAPVAPEPPAPSASADLELAPLVIIPFPVREAVVDAAPVELDLDPIVINLPLPADTVAAAPAAVDDAVEEELFASASTETAAHELAATTAPLPATPRPAPNDPLAALKAMTYEERIALFS